MGDFTASNEVILRECESVNLERLFKKTTQEAVENDDLPTRTEVLRQAIGSGIFLYGGTLPPA